MLFEYPTLQALAGHLASAHAAALAPHFTVSTVSAAAGSAAAEAVVSAPVQPVAAVRQFRRHRSAQGVSRPAADNRDASEPIAIIGMSGSFPQARSIGEFWDNLLQGRDCIGELPPERFGLQASEVGRQPAGVLEGADQFDPLFFNISPREAEGMDPQQRLLMMSVWAALEDAGYAPHSLAGSATALLVGTGL